MSVMPIIDTSGVVAANFHGISGANYTAINDVRSRHVVDGVLTVIF